MYPKDAAALTPPMGWNSWDCYGPAVTEEQGRDLVIYHARPYEEITGDPLYDPNRHTCVMHLTWDASGCPVFDYDAE